MRVLHVIPSISPRTGGPPPLVLQSARSLQALGFETSVIATDMAEAASARAHTRMSQPEASLLAGDVPVRLFPSRPPRRLAFSPALYRALRREARRYDVVHIHSLFLFPQYAAYRAALAAGVPYVVTPHGALDPYLRRRNRIVKSVADRVWQRDFLRRASLLHVTSDEERRQVEEVVPQTPAAVLPNGIAWADYQQLPPAGEFRRRWLRGDDGPLVLFFGRLSHKKGLPLLLDAFAAVRRAVPDARLAIAGPDDEGLQPVLEEQARTLGVGDAVVFTAMLQGREKLSALAAADVWALPSHAENFGIAVAEALAAGRAAVVSTAVNIAPEVAAADAAVVAPPSAEAFASEIIALLEDTERRSALGERARAFAQRYDWSNVAPQFVELYRKAVA